jgi:hypothetical protein
MFNDYSSVNEKYLKIRQIVKDNQKPRRLSLQGHLLKKNDDVIKIFNADYFLRL